MPSKPDAINRSFALAAIVQIKYVHNLPFVNNFIKLSTDPVLESYLGFFITLLESIPEEH